MNLDDVKKELLKRVADMKAHRNFLVERKVSIKETRERDAEAVDITQSVLERHQDNIASLERLIEALEKNTL